VSLGAGITVNSVTVASATTLTANISIGAGAATSLYSDGYAGTELASLPNGFNVTAAHRVGDTEPEQRQQGQQNLNVQVTGQFTKLCPGHDPGQSRRRHYGEQRDRGDCNQLDPPTFRLRPSRTE